MKKIFFLFLAILGLYIFRSWFSLGHLAGFDLPYFSLERLKEFGLLPAVWDSGFGDGIGENTIKYLWVETYLRSVVSIFVNRINLPWELVLRLFWFFPYLVLMIFSPYFFLKKILPDKNSLIIAAGVLVYSFNTYVLLLVFGGQMNIAIAYMIAPLVLYSFINVLTGSRVNGLMAKIVVSGLVLAVQVMFDLRLAYVTMMAVGVYFVSQRLLRQSFHSFLAMTGPVVIVVLLHSFWLLPQVMTKTPALPPGYDNPGWLSFLSWASFSNTISLLHPNWPENIFGKVYFMRTEFLAIPILAFSSLFFLFCHSEPRSNDGARNLTQNKAVEKDPSTSHANWRASLGMTRVVVFALLGLLGAFLAKGVNGPFGEIYYWLFSHVPFFSLFRDPTKFYLLVALSYAALIPFSLTFLIDRINAKIKYQNEKLQFKIKKYLGTTIAVLFIIYLLLLLWPVFSGQVKGTLVKEKIPDEYLKLEQLLSSDKKFSRTLWVPTTHRLSYVTSIHPAIPATKLLDTTDQNKILNLIREATVSAKLQDLAVGYVIIPYDFSNEIFLTDRKYDDKKYQETVKGLTNSRANGLKRIINFGKIVVFELTNAKDHFFIGDKTQDLGLKIQYQMINPTKYEVQLENVQKGDLLVFSERFDKGWMAKVIKSKVHKVYKVEGEKYHGLLNSFVLPESGSYTLEVYYEPQKWVNIGLIVSVGSLILCTLFLVYTILLTSCNLTKYLTWKCK